jgi:hypothetical protein
MKQIYGFKVENPEDWSDVFEDETRSPEHKISSACHIYYDINGEMYIGFDLALGLGHEEMKTSLSSFSQKSAIRKVL